MKRTYAGLISFGLLVFGLSCPSLAYAQKVVGSFAVVKGKVEIKDKKGQLTPAKVGAKIKESDTIIADKDSRAKVVMIDKNELNISPETTVSLDQYKYEPEKNEKNVLINVLYGKVRSTVNQKYDGDNKYQVKTPAAVAGVRGTDFLAGFNAGTKESQFVTFKGLVEVGQPGPGGSILNSVQVAPGQATTAIGGAPPAPPAPMPKSELASLEKESSAEKAPAPSDKREPAADGAKEEKKDKKEEVKEEKKETKQEAKEEKKEAKQEAKEAKQEAKEEKKQEPKQEARKDEPKKDEPKKDAGVAKEPAKGANNDSGKKDGPANGPRTAEGGGAKPGAPTAGGPAPAGSATAAKDGGGTASTGDSGTRAPASAGPAPAPGMTAPAPGMAPPPPGTAPTVGMAPPPMLGGGAMLPPPPPPMPTMDTAGGTCIACMLPPELPPTITAPTFQNPCDLNPAMCYGQKTQLLINVRNQ